MGDDHQRQEGATSPDLPRPAATSDDSDYSLSIEEVAALYEQAGLPRDRRTIQRYCAKGKLVCHSIEIPYGEKYLVTPASVATHIAYIKEVRQAMASRGRPRPAAAAVALENKDEEPGQDAPTSTDDRRPAATTENVSHPVAADTRVVELLERENAFLRAQNDKKDQQLERRDRQIEAMIQRDQETNYLIKRLSDGIPMLAQPDRRGEEARSMQYTDMPDETAAEGRG